MGADGFVMLAGHFTDRTMVTGHLSLQSRAALTMSRWFNRPSM